MYQASSEAWLLCFLVEVLSCLTELLLIFQVLKKSFPQEAVLTSSHPIPYSQDLL